MQHFDATETFRGRRRILGGIAAATGVSAAALVGMNPDPIAARQPAPLETTAPDELFSLARLRNYKNLRSSSWDRSGGNDDWVRVDPGHGSASTLDNPPPSSMLTAVAWSHMSGSPSTRPIPST